MNKGFSLTLIVVILALAVGMGSSNAEEFLPRYILQVDDPAGGLFGGAVACAGDIDGDEYPDILVSDAAYNEGDGRVYIFSGRTGDLIQPIPSHCSGDLFGISIAGIGDVDGGGTDDFIVGSPGYDPGVPESDIGATIYRGEDLSVYMTFRSTDYSQIEDDSEFGWSVSSVPPNADSPEDRNDVIIGAPAYGIGDGAVYLMSTDDGSIICWEVGQQVGISVVGGTFHEKLTKTPYRSYVTGGPYSINKGRIGLYSGDCSEFDTYSGYQNGEDLGRSLANMGPFPQEPYFLSNDWFAVCAPGYDRADIEGYDHGRVLLCRVVPDEGSSQHIDVVDQVWGGHSDTDFGRAVARLGNVCGDERIEMAVGAPSHSAYWGTDVGAVYVYTIDEDGDIRSRGVAYGEETEDRLGFSICGVGDIDEDGRDEFAVGTMTEGDHPGKVYVFGGVTTDYYSNFVGEEPSALFGYSVAAAGDYNNDGEPDIIVGAPNQGAGGKYYVFSGTTTELLEEDNLDADSESFGACVAFGGNLDTDDIDDILVTDPRYDPLGGDADAGVVLACSYFKEDYIWYTFGEQPSDNFGWSVSRIGDVNIDGFDDVVVGAPGRDGTAGNVGRVYVLSGSDGVSISHLMITGDESNGNLGYSVCAGGNTDGGKPDYMAGAPFNAAGVGEACVYSGDDGSMIYGWSGEAAGDQFGFAVLGGYDFDGSTDDFAIGAPFNDEGGTNAGKVYVYSGSDYQLIKAFVGTKENGYFGSHLSTAIHPYGAKTNTADLLIGAPGEDSVGRVYCYAAVTGDLLYTKEGSHKGDEFGASVAGIGDIDEDNDCDIVVGAADNDFAGEDAGRVYTFSGESAAPPLCGDANGSSSVDIDDVVYLIDYIFGGGPEPVPLSAGESDCSGAIDIDDVVYMINYIFLGGSAPCECPPSDNEICMHLNDGADNIVPSDWNTLEVYIANDSSLLSCFLPIEVSWNGPGTLTWDLGYGSNPPVDYSPEALSVFWILASGEHADGVSPDTFAVGGWVYSGSSFSVGSSRELCRLRFQADGNLDNLCVKPIWIPPAGDWYFQSMSELVFPPDFCGSSVGEIDDPQAPPACFTD